MSRVSARPGLLSRLVLTEPVRLYLWLAGFAVILGGVAMGAVTGDVAEWAVASLGGALGVAGAAEAARASVYSQAGHLKGMIASRGSWAVQAAVDADL